MTRKLEKVKNHPGIYKRGSRYVAVYRDQYGKQRKVFARTIKEAEDLKAERRTDVRRGEHRSLSRERFDAYARQWVETCPGRTRRGLRTTRPRAPGRMTASAVKELRIPPERAFIEP